MDTSLASRDPPLRARDPPGDSSLRHGDRSVRIGEVTSDDARADVFGVKKVAIACWARRPSTWGRRCDECGAVMGRATRRHAPNWGGDGTGWGGDGTSWGG